MFFAAVDFNPVEHLYDRWAVWVTLWGAHGTGFITGWNKAMPGFMQISQHVIMMWVVSFGMIAAVSYVTYARNTRVPRGLRNLIEPVLLFIRNDIVRPNIHNPHGSKDKDGEPRHKHWLADQFVPFMFCLFLFIAGMNVIGLLPGASTATSGIVVTGGLAFLVLIVYMIGALRLQGPWAFLVNLVPYKFSLKPMDLFVWGLLFVIELIGLFAKPFALMVRLFANMTGGHCSLLSVLYINQLIGPEIAAWRFATGIPTVAMGIGLYCLDLFVALLQAYIFTYLSAIFIGQYLVPEH